MAGKCRGAAHVASNLLEHSAEAAMHTSCRYKVTATCYESSPGNYFCAYRVCCGASCHIEFDE